ncbi:MAG: extracellular solute-binding protein [Treponema sp.]|jgi:multiple sugar transport system substrate-binding protein|nr:extracellular solute-binding protein [Treponema sp.]
MKDSRKKVDLPLFAVALVILAMALYRWGTSGGFHRDGSATRATRIVFTQWWENELEEDALQEIVTEFESLHKGIEIVLSSKSYEDLRQDFFNPHITVFHGDIFALDLLWVPELQNKEIIVKSEIDPIFTFISVLFYNIEILKDAGFFRPPKTRSEFIDQAKAITGKEKNLWGLALDESSSRWIYDDVFPWIWSAGIQLLKDGKPIVNSRQVIDSFSFLASLNNEGLIVPGDRKKLEDFISGRTAFMIAPARDIKLVMEQMGDLAFDITSVPSPANNTGKIFYGTMAWTIGINSASANKEEARLFADFLTGKASILSQKAGAIPDSNSTDHFSSKLWEIAIAGEPSQEFSGLPWTELEKTFSEELYSLFAGSTSPAEMTAAIQEKWLLMTVTHP